MEGAKIYAQNAIRKKSEALNYLQLASRLDAVVSRLDQQAKMASVSKSMAGIVKTLNVALKNAPLDKMVNVSLTYFLFESLFWRSPPLPPSVVLYINELNSNPFSADYEPIRETI